MTRRSLALSVLLLLAAPLSCGDGGFILIVNTGTVESDARCDSGGGTFDLRDQEGFVLLIVISSDTTIILANGNFGTCADVTAGSRAEVRGSESADRVQATEVQLR
jgi:hypothetical protein